MFLKCKLLLVIILFAVCSYAEGTPNTNRNYKKHYDQGEAINKHSLMQAYNAADRINLYKNHDIFIEGDFIWWQPIEKGLTLGTSNSNSTNFQIDPLNILNFHTNFLSGFKVGVGANHYSDNWTFFSLYTWFNRDYSNSVKKAYAFFSDWTEDEIYQAEAFWKLKLNLIELELSRKNLTGKNVSFSPHFTIIGGWLDQSFFVDSLNNQSSASSNSWLIGPKGGIKTYWKIKSGIKILANVSGTLFYQNYDQIDYTLKNKITSLYIHRIQMKTSYITPNLNLSTGLSFEINFWKKTHVTLHVLYEINHFWNQNQMRYLLDELKHVNFDAGSLMLHGLTASMKWDF